VLTAELTGRNSGFGFAKNTDDLFVGKTLLNGGVLMWLMKTILTSRCVNQRRSRSKPLHKAGRRGGAASAREWIKVSFTSSLDVCGF